MSMNNALCIVDIFRVKLPANGRTLTQKKLMPKQSLMN